ncbi:hypothetical protein JD844_022477 [Phrynosoma platyrhinos]|uniref:Amino acid permease/ SLC12A domain-containing protein n=1 Tax=Phrynosoma platyrhinos TaxID=52577 RepID=A0ABQ7SVD8_PHRPL|nr:hypothetical protein JD844_022477 [Phrynosoma platyrhinos]
MDQRWRSVKNGKQKFEAVAESDGASEEYACSINELKYPFFVFIFQVSLVGFLFLLGLYISSLASCMGGLYGAPRILQCIAQEKVIPSLAFLGQGKGPNRTPVAAICLTSLITMAFIFIGQVNVLAPIVTINFMLTYIAVDYAYFAVSMSYNFQQNLKSMRREDSRVVLGCSRPLILDKPSCYGSGGIVHGRSDGTLLEFTKDMDHLFKPLGKDPGTTLETDKDLGQTVKQRKQKKAAKQTLQASFLLDLDNNIAPAQDLYSDVLESSGKNMQSLSEPSYQNEEVTSPHETMEAKQQDIQDGGHHSDEMQKVPSQKMEDLNTKQQNQELEIQKMPVSFYSRLCDHWVSLIGAIGSLAIMFVIQWIYTLVNLGLAIILYFYIGQVSPGLPPGVAANFSFFKWMKLLLFNACSTDGSALGMEHPPCLLLLFIFTPPCTVQPSLVQPSPAPRSHAYPDACLAQLKAAAAAAASETFCQKPAQAGVKPSANQPAEPPVAGGRPSREERFVVTPSFATVGMETTQLTEENTDFASRDRYHHSSVITREEFIKQVQ